DKAITDGSLDRNDALLAFIAKLKQSGGPAPLMGLLSPGGVHSHQEHIAALAGRLDAQGVPVALHAFLDVRDTPPRSALDYSAKFAADTRAVRRLAIATVSGRYYAMDRDKRWDRVEKAYRAIVTAEGERAPDANSSVEQSYAKDKGDEFVLPTVV